MYGEKLPPHDIDAEEAVVGSLLIDGAAIYKIATFLQKEDFYHEQSQWIYGACLSLYQRPEPAAINQITVAQELDRQGKLEACGGAAYLSHLISNCPTSLDIEHYAQIVYRLAISRRLIDAARQIETIGYQADPDVEDSLGRAENVLFKLRRREGVRDLTHIRQVLDKYFEVAPTSLEGRLEEQVPYVLSSYTGLDEFLGGFQRSELIIVGGRPSMGKTSLSLNIARNAAVEHGACVALFSLEMARDSLVLRLLSSESGVNSKMVRLHTGWSREREEYEGWKDDETRVMEATGVLSEAPIYVDDTPMLRMAEMRGKAVRLNYERGIDLIIVDYLQLMLGDRKFDNRVQEVSEISRSLKGLARELNVPVLAVSQLSRAPEGRALHEPQLSDLRESGSIEQDADVVLFIYRDEYYYKKEEWPADKGEYPMGQADVIIAKNRNGPTGRIKLRFRHNLAKFENIANQEPSLL
ncbi:MAG: replicative DNA helicase [Chloroflexi bacterium]|nr:replicative DNA helicase [Chloroflexota bacterium]